VLSPEEIEVAKEAEMEDNNVDLNAEEAPARPEVLTHHGCHKL
jgi:hypothetical protein